MQEDVETRRGETGATPFIFCFSAARSKDGFMRKCDHGVGVRHGGIVAICRAAEKQKEIKFRSFVAINRQPLTGFVGFRILIWLLTRARQGMVIFVPPGDISAPTA